MKSAKFSASDATLKMSTDGKPKISTASCMSSTSLPLNSSSLARLVGAAKGSLGKQLHPKLLEGLDAALATLEPMKTTDAQSVTEQLFLKAFRNSPGASAELQQILACNTEAAAAILARMQPLEAFGEVGGSIKGDYLVLQTPIIQTPAAPLKQGAKSALPRPTAPKPPAAPQQKPAASEASSSAADSDHSSGRMGGAVGEESSALVVEVQGLRKHKEWADQKIDVLIRRVREAEGPHRLLKEEVQQLRLEKDSVEVKLKDFEVSLQKLKECTYAEAAQRQEYEVTLRQVQAELRGGSLREQEVQGLLQGAQNLLKQEKKRRDSVERQLKKAVEERSELQASVGEAAAARDKVSRELEAARQALKEQFREMQNSQDAAMAAQQQANQAKQWALQMEQQVSAAETRAQELVGLVAALNCQLEEASSSGHHTDHSSEQEHDSSASLYSHFEGKGIFGGGGSSLWFQDPVASCPAGL